MGDIGRAIDDDPVANLVFTVSSRMRNWLIKCQ